ncbi:unnamed protein product, partial [Laminaria digitata]
HAFSLPAPPRTPSSPFLTGEGIPSQPKAPTSTSTAHALTRPTTSARKTFTLSGSRWTPLPCPPPYPGADKGLVAQKRTTTSGGISKFGSFPNRERFISSLSSTGGGGG